MKSSVWNSEVRSHEVDCQGIVNNASYLNYFDHARSLNLKENDIDWHQSSKKGLNLVLSSSEIKFIRPLLPFDKFLIETKVSLSGKMKILFEQSVFDEGKKNLYCSSKNYVACFDSNTKKPIPIKVFFEKL